jgi:hypothetical protein
MWDLAGFYGTLPDWSSGQYQHFRHEKGVNETFWDFLGL